MTYTIKKYKGSWLVNDNNGGWVGFNDHAEAVSYAYDQGATEVTIKYSNNIGRTFTRQALENLNLIK